MRSLVFHYLLKTFALLLISRGVGLFLSDLLYYVVGRDCM